MQRPGHRTRHGTHDLPRLQGRRRDPARPAEHLRPVRQRHRLRPLPAGKPHRPDALYAEAGPGHTLAPPNAAGPKSPTDETGEPPDRPAGTVGPPFLPKKEKGFSEGARDAAPG